MLLIIRLSPFSRPEQHDDATKNAEHSHQEAPSNLFYLNSPCSKRRHAPQLDTQSIDARSNNRDQWTKITPSLIRLVRVFSSRQRRREIVSSIQNSCQNLRRPQDQLSHKLSHPRLCRENIAARASPLGCTGQHTEPDTRHRPSEHIHVHIIHVSDRTDHCSTGSATPTPPPQPP